MTDKLIDDKRMNDKLIDDEMADDKSTAAKVIGDARTAGRFAAGPCAASRLWIGFIELEAWAEAVDPSRPVLLLPVVHPSHDDRPSRNGGPAGRGAPYRGVDLRVACQQVTSEGHVLYCLLRAVALARACDPVVDAHWVFQTAAWESLWECAGEMLEGRGLRVLPATAAFPPDLSPVFGDAGGVRYDGALLRFRRVRPA